MLKVGCCGFPGGMEKYFERFKLVELQKTFYSLPKLTTAEKWREKAPEGFEFSLKAWQLITHPPRSPTYRKAGITIPESKKESYGFFRPTDEVFRAWEETKKIANALRAEIVVFQCPPSLKPTEENTGNMKEFFNSIDRGNLRFAWEPRGEWKDETIKGLCEELGLIHCVDPFMREMAYSTDIAYLRLHGSYKKGRIDYKYKYTKEDLKGLLEKCKRIEAGDIYCLFNNIHMLEDALEFQGMI